VESGKLNDIEPQAYLTDILTKLVEGWPMRRFDELLPGSGRSSRAAIGRPGDQAGLQLRRAR
jgi:transposase